MKIGRKELIKKYLEFFKSKSHKVIPNSSLVPKNDPTVLFTTAGMHPLVPYLLGQKHPLGKRLCDVQRCIRTQDIDEVGDTFHHTFFEMLGNWSLGDYFKEEAIKFSFEFLTKELGIKKERLAVTVFKGDKDAPRDKESAKVWKSLGIPEERIAFLEKEDNWWGPAGKTGPCGPDTEMFYWKSNEQKAPKKFDPKDRTWVEIWNDVLMQYNKNEKGKYENAKQKNIDTGMGVERTTTVLNGLEDNYLTNMWKPLIEKIESLSKQKYEKEEIKHYMRIIADHIKAAVFIIADGVTPSNTEQGYVLRRLIRRAIRYGHVLGIKNFTPKVAEPIFKIYDDYEILKDKESILRELEEEEERFEKGLEEGLKIAKKIFSKKIPLSKEKAVMFRTSKGKTLEKMEQIIENKKEGKKYGLKEFNISEEDIDNALITKEEAFYLYQSFGFPKDMLIDFAIEERLLIDTKGFDNELKKHQQLSRTAAEGKFKSGLADNSEQTRKLHTATHMLNSALKIVLKDKNIHQKGSNITPERLRFDFNFPRKLTQEELKQIEDLMNEKIQQSLEVKREEMPLKKALSSGAEAEFGAKYPEKVSVYTILDPREKKGFFSKEICTGPHVNNTREIGHFKITKEESSSAGIRRIKATVD